MRNDFCTGYLMHHGIKGQKWGKRNGPPYPLDSSQKSSSEKRSEKKGLTDKQKKYIAIGAVVAATALASYGVYKLGGPKVAAKKIANLIKSGRKSSKQYMKMNLQYFAKKKKKINVRLPRDPSKYRALRPDEFPVGSHPTTALQEAINNHRDKIKSGKAFSFSHGNHIYVIVGDGEGYSGRIIDCVPIADAVTKLYKRIPYVK